MNDFPFKHIKLYDLPLSLNEEIPFKGNLNSSILVIIQENCTPEVKDYLGKILSSVNLDSNKDVTIIQLNTHSNLRLSKLPYEKILVFGISPKRLGFFIQPELYDIVKIGSQKLIFSNDLNDIFLEKVKKERKMASLLWNSLKELFG